MQVLQSMCSYTEGDQPLGHPPRNDLGSFFCQRCSVTINIYDACSNGDLSIVPAQRGAEFPARISI